GTGRIDTRALVEHYQEYLWKSGFLVREKFDYSALEPGRDEVNYGRLRAKRIVFATGIGLRENPYFNYLPLQGTKGELLTIRAPQLKELSVIKSSVFIIPLGDDLYSVGATYNWKDKSNEPTVEARKELLDKLHSFLRCDYELLDQIAGIRPTVADRRPLVGRHPVYTNLFVLNGFGSRGVMIGPYAAGGLFAFIQKQIPLPSEMDVQRFDKKYKEQK
ncbi:MAG: NAD(P)/FAD-dependent oxidoreductase, partial [Flavobacteriaceae bacterium]